MFLFDKYELDTKVISCEKENDQYVTVLENTIFYPGGGGQPSDEGYIDDVEVIKVYSENDKIYHVTSKKLEGDVHLKIDKQLRDKYSTLHTAQHLISRFFENDGANIDSFNITKEHSMVDISKIYTKEELENYEIKCNLKIAEAIPIFARGYEESSDDKLLEGYNIDKDKVRIVCIGNFDVVPCGGTHLNNTKDLLIVKIVKFKTTKKGTRMWIKAGIDALKDIQKTYDLKNDLVQLTSSNEDNIFSFISEKLKDNKNLKKEINKLKGEINQ